MTVQGQMGFKSETTYGTGVTVDTFHEGYLSGNPVRTQEPLVSMGVRAGRRTPVVAKIGPKTVQGPFNLELFPAPLATLLTHMFGSVSTQADTPGVGQHTHTATPGSLDDNSFTAQVGIYGTGGTVHPFTYTGCKLNGWTINGTAGEIATLELDVLAQDYVTSTALASASYGDEVPFTFVDGSVSVAGSSVAEVNSFSLAATIPQRVKHGMGSALIMKPYETGRRSHLITVETEFKDLTLHALANTEVAVVLTFSNGTESLTITTNAWVTPTTPEHPGVEGETTETFSAFCIDDSTDAGAITAVLVNDEAAAT